MKKFLVLVLLLGTVLCLLPARQARAVPIGGTEQKLDTAKAAILYELNTDTFVYTWNPDMTINPTGMVKFLTAWIAIEEGNLDDMVTVSQKVLNTVLGTGAVTSGLVAGEEISLRDLLYCVMVSSGNDAAAVIADYIGGSLEAFVAKMNARAQAVGCTASNFTNPHGLTDSRQVSTARDLTVIVREALKNETFAKMFGCVKYTVPATNKSKARELITTNYMLREGISGGYYDERVTGGKPAAATTKDRSVICTAEQGTSRYLCVVMSAEAQVTANGLSVKKFTNYLEASELLDYGFKNFSIQQVLDAGESFRQHSVEKGENAVVVQPAKDLFAVLPKEYDKAKLQYLETVDISKLTAPVVKGQKLGVLQVKYGDVTVGTCDLVAMHAVKENGTGVTPADRLEAELTFGQKALAVLKWIGRGVLVLLFLAAAVIIYLFIRRNARIKEQHRRRMRSRRRME